MLNATGIQRCKMAISRVMLSSSSGSMSTLMMDIELVSETLVFNRSLTLLIAQKQFYRIYSP
jgi:hypothetical protein